MWARTAIRIAAVVVAVAAMAAGDQAWGQVAVSGSAAMSARPWASNVIVPQSRVYGWDRQPVVRITEVAAGVDIMEQAATTTLDISLSNPGGGRIEGELVVPVPDDAVVRGFTFQGGGAEPRAELLPKDEARRMYESIVAKSRDPALLEFVGCNLIRSSVFPIEAHGTQKVRLVYEHLLTADGNRVDYVLPRTESVQYMVPWRVTVHIRSKRPVSTVYSPSHALTVARVSGSEVIAKTTEAAANEPGSLRLSYLLQENGVTASLVAYPDPKTGGGYFLLLAGLPATPNEFTPPGPPLLRGGEAAPAGGEATPTSPPLAKGGEVITPGIKREITLVLDRSGSMNGEKIEQVKAAAMQVLAGLTEGEAFNLITYNDAVSLYSPEPVIKSEASVKAARAFLQAVNAQGGTNIHDALAEALRLKPAAGMLPIVLFLTDGLPTVGQTSEAVIRDVAMKANTHERRIFSFGVGVDVNTPLLEKIAAENRGTATFVLPREDVEVKVAQVFKRLSGPVLAEPALAVLDDAGGTAPGRVLDVLPSKLPDLFAGDQLVLLGRYTGSAPLVFQLKGNYLGAKRAFRFRFELDKATTRNAFVPRLWASRKIGILVDAIRQMGAEEGLRVANSSTPVNPKLKELVDEIVRISTEFGILTEYTAFLAQEGTDLSKKADVLAQAGDNFNKRAIQTRSGYGSLNQEDNQMFMKSQAVGNARNGYTDEKMNRVAITTVQQVNDRAFYRKGNRWVDSQVVERESSIKSPKVVEFGSDEFARLMRRLVQDGRQGTVSLGGDILMVIDGQEILVKMPEKTEN